jgi:hypothetical protein
MGRRQELRLRLELTVRLWGADVNGQPFEQYATTVDVTRTGARLKGILHPIQCDSIVEMQHRDSKAKFRVRWIGKPKAKDQIGLELIKREKFDWGRSIPIIPGDSFVIKPDDEEHDIKYLK